MSPLKFNWTQCTMHIFFLVQVVHIHLHHLKKRAHIKEGAWLAQWLNQSYHCKVWNLRFCSSIQYLYYVWHLGTRKCIDRGHWKCFVPVSSTCTTNDIGTRKCSDRGGALECFVPVVPLKCGDKGALDFIR
jgi:hypothetical protein